MVQKFNEDQGFPLTSKQATEYIKLFGFIAEVNSSIYFLEEELQPPKRQGKVFIVPPMLPWNLPEAETKLSSDKNENVCIVYFKFPDNFIPVMVFYQMLAACIDRNIEQSENLCQLRRHMIKLVLGIDQYYYVSLSDEKDSIRLAITPDEYGVVSAVGLQNRWNLVTLFCAKLKETMATFMPASAPPECYIPCNLCPKLHLKLDEIRANQMPLCCSRGKLAPDYYQSLRQYPVVPENKTNLSTSSAAKDSGDGSLPPIAFTTKVKQYVHLSHVCVDPIDF
ncbi:uncharacterized protein [Dysidea avara]|uniref:uncharacterized protein n=1 Tax=Dysidea avara TaxID=196820 RepID=UPI0033205CFE